MRLTIGIDVGGTKAAAGVVGPDGRIVEKLKRSTPAASPPETERVIAEVVTELTSRHDVAAVGIGAAGFIDETRSTVVFAPNLAWRDEPLRKSVQEKVGLPVFVENDANASLWAESRFGAARGYRDVFLIAVGTGIGASIMIGGDLYRGAFGIAGEPGHYRVVPDGRLCGCGNRGCWERYASGSALVAEAREFARRSPEAAHAAAAARWRDARGHLRPAGHPGGPGRRSGGVAVLPDRGRLAGPGHGRPGRDPRPGLLRHRRRRIRSGQPARRSGPVGLREGRCPAVATAISPTSGWLNWAPTPGVVGAADLARRHAAALSASPLATAPGA